MCVCMHVCVCVHVLAEAAKKGIKSGAGARVRGGCKQHNRGSGNQILVLWKNSKLSWPSFSPKLFVIQLVLKKCE